MIALLLLFQAAPGVDAAAIAARLETGFKASLTGGARCKVARSTGDAAIDAIGCRALDACVPQYQSRYQASGDRAIRAGVKKVMRAALDAELADCLASERKAGVAALAAQRGGAR